MDNTIEPESAVQRLTPKRPLASTSGRYGVCPCCECLVSKYEHEHGNIVIPHCKWCGQALDWEGVKINA